MPKHRSIVFDSSTDVGPSFYREPPSVDLQSGDDRRSPCNLIFKDRFGMKHP